MTTDREARPAPIRANSGTPGSAQVEIQTGRFARLLTWRRRWRGLFPIFLAEFVLLVGFGALLPILPLYIVEHDIDETTLGLILAAWPFGRLVTEPLFGWMGDRISRKALMIAGLVLATVTTVLPLLLITAPALFVLRALTGVAGAMYDPSARAFLVDATSENERGEAFGVYTAAQMSGLVIGPALGAFGSAVFGGLEFPFVLAGAMSLVALAYLAVTLPPGVPSPGGKPASPPFSPDPRLLEVGGPERAAASSAPDGGLGGEVVAARPPRSLLNRSAVGAAAMNFGLYCTIGVYEVVWSLYLQRLGASLGLIGLTFTLFAIPVLLVGPPAGRLVDRRGPLAFAVLGASVVVAAMVVYALATEPILPSAVIVVEGAANAVLGPAIFAVMALGTPAGRAATAQGVFGAAGTVGFIVASLSAGWLYELDPRYPFYVFAAVAGGSFAVGALIASSSGVSGWGKR